jgi:hypothetical protein
MKFYDLLIRSRVQKEGELWNQLSEEQKNELLSAESESHYQKNLIDHKTQSSASLRLASSNSSSMQASVLLAQNFCLPAASQLPHPKEFARMRRIGGSSE